MSAADDSLVCGCHPAYHDLGVHAPGYEQAPR